MKTERVLVDGLRVGARMRSADPARVATLAASMERHGLLQPITARMVGETEAELVAGLHRLEAAKHLGWEWIDAVFVEADDIERELIEIAENLHRCDLTKEERDRQIRRYAELLEAKPAVSQQSAAKLSVRGRAGEGRPVGVARQIADQTGLSVDTVRRAINPPPKPVPPAREPHNDYEAVQKQVDSLMRAWNAAGPEAREQFLERVDRPVFDRTAAA